MYDRFNLPLVFRSSVRRRHNGPTLVHGRAGQFGSVLGLEQLRKSAVFYPWDAVDKGSEGCSWLSLPFQYPSFRFAAHRLHHRGDSAAVGLRGSAGSAAAVAFRGRGLQASAIREKAAARPA